MDEKQTLVFDFEKLIAESDREMGFDRDLYRRQIKAFRDGIDNDLIEMYKRCPTASTG